MKRFYLITLIAVTFFLGCQNTLTSTNTTLNTKSSTPIVSKVHWITVHIRNDETFTSLYTFFKDDLQFPVFFTLKNGVTPDIQRFWLAMLFLKYAVHIQIRQF